MSEGRDTQTISALSESVSRSPGASLLDCSSDRDHHRSVLTLAGSPEALREALIGLYREAIDRIDLAFHEGVHPRVGAVDVVPFVPIGAATMKVAVETARALAEVVARRFDLPVFLYGEAARNPLWRLPAGIRRVGIAELGKLVANDPAWLPDFGPRRLHPTAGATLIGARGPLIAFNAVLASDHLDQARSLARALRESSGGLPAVQAIGVPLHCRGRVQVSMNLLDFRRTSPLEVVRRLRHLAAEIGEEVLETEIVGLVPRAALEDTSPRELGLRGFDESKILEERLAQAGLV